MTPPRLTRRALTGSLELPAVGGLVVLVLVAVLLGGIRDGSVGEVGQRIYGKDVGWWALYASTNSILSIALTVSMSTVIGVALGLTSTNRRRALLRRWLELSCALPAFVVTALWVTSSPDAPLLVLGLCVAGQRGLQIAVLIGRAEQCRLTSLSTSLYPVEKLERFDFRRWSSLLWVAAAHSAVLHAAEHAALVLLELIPPVPNTWTATLCSAATGAADVSVVAVTVAVAGSVVVPWALWARSTPASGTSSVT